jgi:ribonuclease HI
MEYKKLTIYTDGGSSNNPGPAGIGIVFYSSKKIICKYSGYIGEKTNNQAEYGAVLKALEINEEKFKAKEIDFVLDSELVVKQLKGEYKIKNPELAVIATKIKEKIKNIKTSFTHVLRDKNEIADSLVKKAIKSKASRFEGLSD